MNRDHGRTRAGNAERLSRIVLEQPGIHFRALERAAGLTSVGQLRYHIDHLVHEAVLVEHQDGGYKRFFVAGKHDPHLRTILALFARSVPRRIGTLLLDGPMSRTELRRSLDRADSTLGFHLSRMLDLGVLTRGRDHNVARYALVDPPLVRKVLLMGQAIPAPPPAGPVPPWAPAWPLGGPASLLGGPTSLPLLEPAGVSAAPLALVEELIPNPS